MTNNQYQNLTQYDLDKCLIEACELGDIKLVKYLLTSNELSNHADINTFSHGENGLPLRNAFYKKNWNLAKYLLTSPELNIHADIHIASDDIFKSAFYTKNIDVLECLVFDYNIKRNHIINNILDASKKKDNGYMAEHVEKLFSIRQINKELNNELINTDKAISNSKNKV